MTRSTEANVRWLPQQVPLASVQGALALELTPLLDPPHVEARPGGPGGDLVQIDPAARERLEGWAGLYVQAAVEIVSGERPPTQVIRWTRRDVYADLVRRAELVASAGQHQVGQGRRRLAERPHVASVRLNFLDSHTAEAAARVRHGGRSRAVALRLAETRDRWLCTALEFC